MICYTLYLKQLSYLKSVENNKYFLYKHILKLENDFVLKISISKYSRRLLTFTYNYNYM